MTASKFYQEFEQQTGRKLCYFSSGWDYEEDRSRLYVECTGDHKYHYFDRVTKAFYSAAHLAAAVEAVKGK